MWLVVDFLPRRPPRAPKARSLDVAEQLFVSLCFATCCLLAVYEPKQVVRGTRVAPERMQAPQRCS